MSDRTPSTFSDSSKTGSSKSIVSVPKERDFTKDNVGGPLDLEVDIQAERIAKILKEAINKTKLALCLPKLVQDFKFLSSQLTTQHIDDLMCIFDQYDNPLFSASLINTAAMEDIKVGNISLANRLNPELGHVLYIMNSYPSLKTRANEMYEQMKKQYALSPKPNPSLDYLIALEHFEELMTVHLNTSAADDLATKLNTRRLEESNAKLLVKIEEYSKMLKEENDQFEEMMSKKSQMITKLEKELLMLTTDANLKLQKQVLDSDRQMVLATRVHTIKNEMLKEEAAECRDAYRSVLRQHLIDEQNQRARRFKVEKQLTSWLQKYDLDMGDKQLDLDDLTHKYEEQCRICKDLEDQIAEQDKEYLPLMAEREAEYQQEMFEKMTKFRRDHAARVLQAAWREVLFNRNEKKRLRKLLKKKQEAEKKH